MPPEKPSFYTTFRRIYLTRMGEIYPEKLCPGFYDDEPPRLPPCTIQDMEKMKKIIKQADESNKTYVKAKDFYELGVKATGEEIIVLKRQPGDDSPPIRVLSYDEAFDEMYNIHVKRHCHRKYVTEYLKGRYAIPPRCIAEVSKLCPTCVERRKSKKEKSDAETAAEPANGDSQQCNESSTPKEPATFNTNIYFTVLHRLPPDNNFKHFLVYCDSATNFTILRPLISVSPGDIAVELVKIFSDFGPPLHITVYKLNKTLIKSVLDEVNKVWPFDIEAFSFVDGHLAVHTYLESWLKETNSNSWSIGLHIIQWRLNSKIFTGNSHFYNKHISKLENNKECAVTKLISIKQPSAKMLMQENTANLAPPSPPSTSKTLENDPNAYSTSGHSGGEGTEDTPNSSDNMDTSTQCEDLHIKEEIDTEPYTFTVSNNSITISASSAIEQTVKTKERINFESYFVCGSEADTEDHMESTTEDVKLETDMSSYVVSSAPQMENKDGTGPIKLNTLNPMLITPSLQIPGGASLTPVLLIGSNLTENTEPKPSCSYSDVS